MIKKSLKSNLQRKTQEAKRMAALDDLISQIPDESLRERIRAEMKRANRQKKFGLVFEEHLPEATPLYDIPVKRGSVVAKKDGQVTDIYYVEEIEDGQATCFHKATKERVVLPVDALACVAQFGEPIYPYLQPLDTVCNAPDSDLWHTLIEADNYHALQLLEYLYAGKVDCIYIDPPYNTGARDWKYNNDYVDGNDTYRHSKWLSMMEKRLKLAKRLLNPADSVMIVTIDEKEYLHLGCLLEELFPNARIQMVSIANNLAGVQRANEFGRVNEFAFFIMIGEAVPQIIDFFAGSGTTCHAVNLLNAEDGGHRRCIMVTNNEVSDNEAKALTKRGFKPGDEEWNRLGIARYITWPRTVCSLKGYDINGKPIKGDYLTSGEEPMHMADGFKANAAFFKLGFLDKNAVALGRQFKELLPVLWLKAGAHGPCPALEEAVEVPAMLVLPVNHFAVLTDESQYETFAAQVNGEDSITTVYIVTDSEPGYREMISGLNAEDTYQLYRDYLDNFRINHGGR